MPDDQINLLRSAVSGLADVVTSMVQSAKPDQINFAQQEDLNQRLSLVRQSLDTVAVNGADPVQASPAPDEHDRS